MTNPISALQQNIARRKALVAEIREHARKLFVAGMPGIQIATSIGSRTDQLILSLVDETLEPELPRRIESVTREGAVIAVGGTGRRELAPFSDIDLLFLHQPRDCDQFQQFVSRFVQTCWDSGLQLGHSTRDISECVTFGRQDPQIATAMIESRLLWGNEKLFESFLGKFRRSVVTSRRRNFIEDCLEARMPNWDENAPPSQELEPDIKNSAGGLRDLHLIRWIGFAQYGVQEIDSLRLKGALSKADAKRLKEAWEFLTRLRIDLHLHAGKEQDRLTKDEQLRIARARGFEETAEQRPVEQFMREYFHHSSQLATITQRFVARERPRSLAKGVGSILIRHRADQMFLIDGEYIDVATRDLPRVCKSLESILRLYKSAALNNVRLAPHIVEAIKDVAGSLGDEVTPECARLFRDLLRSPQTVGRSLRSLFQTGILDVVIPAVTHIRNLLQFNQYHHFTVDEHTLRAVEKVATFEQDSGPIGTAYRAIKHKDLLHLAVLLHDIGKGFRRDHCEVGAEIAEQIGPRLMYGESEIEKLSLLVLKHLEMADVAFRRDITDAKMIIEFSREIGSPDTLRMLYVLTAADVSAVGPDTWTTWKANLLSELFDRCLVILSGMRYSFHEEQRLKDVKEHVAARLEQPVNTIDNRLRGFSAYYLTCTATDQIAADLRAIEHLNDHEIAVVGTWDADTGTIDYRVITKNSQVATECFHKMAGVLSAMRLEVISGDINTTDQGVVIDRFGVVDRDYVDEPPPERITMIGNTLRSVLIDEQTVEGLFQKHVRYGDEAPVPQRGNLPARVEIDNDSSESRTIIDVFAYDRPGLLYKVARKLNELNLSIDLAKISTHFDQVIDVFYVLEKDGTKINSSERLACVEAELERALEEFRTLDQQECQPS